jgi:hypothetical protein
MKIPALIAKYGNPRLSAGIVGSLKNDPRGAAMTAVRALGALGWIRIQVAVGLGSCGRSAAQRASRGWPLPCRERRPSGLKHENPGITY